MKRTFPILIAVSVLGGLIWQGSRLVTARDQKRVTTDTDQLPRNAEPLRTEMKKLRPLHTKLGPPEPGEWLAQHEESGQTFAEYIRGKPVTPTKTRTTLYIQPVGDFNKTEREIIALTAEYMGLYFQLPVKIQEELPLSIIPEKARRVHPTWGVKQILSTYVLDELLRPRLPRDAVCMLALTASDLWPGKGWNFVFGQASLRHRVGVWSMARNGDPEKSKEDFRLCLRRTLQTATHETGHMFSIQHCTAYECNMCGSNSQAESDKRPMYLCPECHAKILWATDSNAIKRYEKLKAFCDKYGLKDDATYYHEALQALK